MKQSIPKEFSDAITSIGFSQRVADYLWAVRPSFIPMETPKDFEIAKEAAVFLLSSAGGSATPVEAEAEAYFKEQKEVEQKTARVN